jgi:glutamate N-acetyltransferase/amino-acid N-acetyltransferase
MPLDLPVSPLAPKTFPDLPTIGGMTALAARIGLYRGPVRNDLILVHFPEGAVAAGVFTRSLTASADVQWCRKALKDGGGRARVLIVNAGNSNAFTGKAGEEKNAASVAEAVRLTGCAPEEVFLAATGVIGVPLPPRKVADVVAENWDRLGTPDIEALARAFMTTDTFAKGAVASAAIGGKTVNIVGIAKGSGMIAPNMATMLVYLFTDADLDPAFAQAALATHTETTFNAITVDGDTSTSDSLMLFATGASGAPRVSDPDGADGRAFSDALHTVMEDLAHQVVRDGEGASRFVSIEVTGAVDFSSARRIGFSIANSPLIKTAIAAGDANWGRVVMAVGKAGEPIDPARLAIRFGDVEMARNGAPSPDYDETRAAAHLQGQTIAISVDVGVGTGRAMVWTCDLTHGYVDINGAYRT